MDEPNIPNILNIPAYQRKRSINAKARKKPEFLETALDRAQSAQKRAKKNRKTSSAKKSTSKNNHFYQKSSSYSSPIIEEIPIQTTLPSQELFPNPFTESESQINNNNFREMRICGTCEGYFDKIDVAIIKVSSPLRIGDRIIFEKHEGLFEQEIESMQLNRKDINLATTGSEIGLKVHQKPTVGAPVYKVIE